MGAKIPNKVTIWRAIQLCCMAIFAPKRFAEAEASDNAVLNAAQNAPPEASVLKIRRALLNSLLLVLLAGAVGWVFGAAFTRWVGSACSSQSDSQHSSKQSAGFRSSTRPTAVFVMPPYHLSHARTNL